MVQRQDPQVVQRKISVGDGLLAAHVFLAVVGALYIFTRILGVAGCDDRCDYRALNLATRGSFRVIPWREAQSRPLRISR